MLWQVCWMVLNVILSLSFRHYLRPDADCCPKSTKSNARWPKNTDSRARNYGSFKFVKFVLKIAPNRGVKFGIARKMLYLCRALGKCSASVGCGSA